MQPLALAMILIGDFSDDAGWVRVAGGKFWSDIAGQRLCVFGGRVLIVAATVRPVLPMRGGGGRGGGADVLRGAAALVF